MPNERKTEELVRQHLKDHGSKGQILEEQTSDDPRVKRALAKASKSGSGVGKPEFVVRFDSKPDLVLVVECKASVAMHASKNGDQPAQYAVDGVLLYSAHLSKTFDVIALAVSGTDPDNLKVSTFRQLRGGTTAELLADELGPVEKLIPVDEYLRLLTFDPAIRRRSQDELMVFSQGLHAFLRDYAKLSENEKPLAVSGTLLALRDDAFKSNWRGYKRQSLGRELIAALRREVEEAVAEPSKQKVMLAPYQFLELHPELNRVPEGRTEWPLRALVGLIEEHVRPFLDTYRDIDVIGQFYGEFLRYTGGDKQGLGIVLTPRHLTELFVRIAGVSLNDTVLDTCCGTGGFLIAALAEMDRQAGSDHKLRDDIRQHRLVGVEQQPQMFALAASNMILRGDGKANLFQGSCFDPDIVDKLTKSQTGRFDRPNVGLINPPFAQQGEGLHELDFVLNLLGVLRPGGIAVVVLPMSCAIEPNGKRSEILKKHNLIASISLPQDIFHPVGVITCALVFKAHHPHATAQAGTWFGRWKNDGFVKLKKRGRVDVHGTWPGIRDAWLQAFHSRTIAAGQSTSRKVGPDEEWVAEAYLDADYSSLTSSDFSKVVREFAIYQAVTESETDEEGEIA